MQFEKVTKLRGTGGGVGPVKFLATSTRCGSQFVASSDHLHRRYFSLFRRKSLTRGRSMTDSRGFPYQRSKKSYSSVGVNSIRFKLMKSEAIGEEDTTADPAVCEH